MLFVATGLLVRYPSHFYTNVDACIYFMLIASGFFVAFVLDTVSVFVIYTGRFPAIFVLVCNILLCVPMYDQFFFAWVGALTSMLTLVPFALLPLIMIAIGVIVKGVFWYGIHRPD